jgi:hypothetical protein
MEHSAPMRDALLRKLEDLRSGSAGRAEVASWAIAIVDDDSVRVTDQTVMRSLKRLGAVDLPAPDRDCLYTETDFDEWKADLLGNY